MSQSRKNSSELVFYIHILNFLIIQFQSTSSFLYKEENDFNVKSKSSRIGPMTYHNWWEFYVTSQITLDKLVNNRLCKGLQKEHGKRIHCTLHVQQTVMITRQTFFYPFQNICVAFHHYIKMSHEMRGANFHYWHLPKLFSL